MKQLLAFILMLSLLGSTDLSAQFAEESVLVAYELRMKGETRYARAMLQKLLDRDQAVGMADYEFARLKMAQMMGGSNVNISSIINSARQAVKTDSGNVAFAYTETSALFGQAYRAIMEEAENAKQLVSEAIACFERVVELKPDYHEARMQLMAKARGLDLFFSRASDVPGMEIYIPPGEIYRSGKYSSFLRQF